MDWEQVSKKMSILNWVILLILGMFSFFFAEAAFTMGIIFGGLIIIANFNLLQYTIRNAFSGEGVMKAKKKSLIVKSYLRLAILGAVIYILITKSLVNPLGLAVGLSTVVISIVTIGIHMVLKQSTWERI